MKKYILGAALALSMVGTAQATVPESASHKEIAASSIGLHVERLVGQAIDEGVRINDASNASALLSIDTKMSSSLELIAANNYMTADIGSRVVSNQGVSWFIGVMTAINTALLVLIALALVGNRRRSGPESGSGQPAGMPNNESFKQPVKPDASHSSNES